MSKLITDPKVIHYIQTVKELRARHTLHAGQQKVADALFRHGKKRIMVQCGRKWGKTEFVSDVGWKWSRLFSGSGVFYIAPFQKQANEIIWANRRVQNYGPRQWLKRGSGGMNNSELRLRFTNESFFKLDGADNYDAHRGTEPHLLFYEEYKDHRKEFHDSMGPNLSVYEAPLIIIGTPPSQRDHQWYRMRESIERDPNGFFYQASTYENPHISREWLANEKETLYARGEGDVWEREYMARDIFGGHRSIFPMLSKDMVKPHDEIMASLARDVKKLEWVVAADPGTATCFAVLFMAINPYTKTVYLLDEIYETHQQETSTDKIGKRIRQQRNALNAYGDWVQVCDEAALWFINEMSDRFDDGFGSTAKALNKKESGLSLIKDIMLGGKLVISDKCEKTYWEMENYIKDDKDKIPKINDHEIDCFRYGLGAVGYSLNAFDEPEEPAEFLEIRGKRIQDDYPELDGFGQYDLHYDGDD
jgi:hypothetical protein